MSEPVAPPQEKTFRKFSHQQGAEYAQHRRDYHPKLYQTLVDHHTSTGGQFDTLLDVGCGPGLAARALAPHFRHVIGIDPSEGMLNSAIELGGESASSEPIPDGSVDLLVVSTAAHWFNMPLFWARAAQVLKPGGTVALWTNGSIIRLDDYMEPGNRHNRELYVNMQLPWTVPDPVTEFDKESFVRKEWGTDTPVSDLEKVMATTSPVARWREAHPDAANTEEDITRTMRREIEKAMHDAGVEEGKELLSGTAAAVMLIVKKKA
ncbi:unnamed protein product [Parascedosporium putredinis]|uniref:Methyltransferase type 11 domain-containing protein n=1 Tax=Parascedosporium putredinis TaxID=1442378 RepID=A0A9P1GY80_9PEZI|nr:unnamed protein product [Parascedosporium putredinis]CAI7989665.1 unnamed protein product [Parascedosporium putredinis]